MFRPFLSKGFSIALSMVLMVFACGRGQIYKVFIDDNASLLTANGMERIEVLCAKALKDLNIHIRVVTLNESGKDMADMANHHFGKFRSANISMETKKLLLLIDSGGKRIKLKAGKGLENIYLSGFIDYMEKNMMVSFFKSGRIEEGIIKSIELIVHKAFGATEPSLYRQNEGLLDKRHFR